MKISGVEGNEIHGSPTFNKANITFHGKNSKIFFHDGVHLENVNINLHENSFLEIGEKSIIKGSFLLQINCSIIIGEKLRCNSTLNISTAEETKVKIGNNCLIASAHIRSSDMHPIYDLLTNERLNYGEDVLIGNDVWFGQEVLVLKGAKVGSGSVIAARSLLTNREFPEHSLIAGNPAKIIRSNVYWKGKMPLLK